MNADPSSQMAFPSLSIVLPDGRRNPVSEGEFRSLEGKLLFVRRGSRLEIRCPRSKALYAVEWENLSSAGADTNDSESDISPVG